MFPLIFDLFERGGIMMYPLLLCSVLVLTLTIERVLVLRRQSLLPKSALERWRSWLGQGVPVPLPPSSPALLDQLLLPILPYFPIPLSRLEERFSDLSRKAKNRLERGVVYLDTIAGVAPLLGLLGTALGMVEVFAKLSLGGQTKIEALSGGISQALLTTVAGLVVGIPALIAANLFTRQIENLLLSAEDQVNGLLDQYFDQMIDHETR
ncbi:MAG: MotA/TolQ/ExbB proton channel family protein [bacterium]|nr:MotA/TolQ/ExbB proton channel family protein [bacterium]